MKGIIIYKSKYGATKKYAEWLAEETGYEHVEVSKVRASDLKRYEILIFGGGIYASGLPVTDFLRKNWKDLSDKKSLSSVTEHHHTMKMRFLK